MDMEVNNKCQTNHQIQDNCFKRNRDKEDTTGDAMSEMQ